MQSFLKQTGDTSISRVPQEPNVSSEQGNKIIACRPKPKLSLYRDLKMTSNHKEEIAKQKDREVWG